MRMADQQDLDVGKLEPELLDAVADQRDIRLEIAVDEDMAVWRRNEIVCEATASDVIEVAGDLERRKRLRPVGGLLRERAQQRHRPYQPPQDSLPSAALMRAAAASTRRRRRRGHVDIHWPAVDEHAP